MHHLYLIAAVILALRITPGACDLRPGPRTEAGVLISDAGPDRGVSADAGAPSAKTITFAYGSAITGQTLYAVDTATRKLTASALFSTSTRFTHPLTLVGRPRHHAPIARDRPQQVTTITDSPIYLPRGRGYLKYFEDVGRSRAGVFVYRPGGAVEVLYSASTVGSGGSVATVGRSWAVSDDGTYAAATRNSNTGVVLVRTDGLSFPTKKVYLDVAISPKPGYIYPTSLTFSAKNLWFISRASSASSQHTLWRVPLDGRSGALAVALPLVGKKKPTWIDDEIAVSGDGSRIAITAGGYYKAEYSVSEDIISITDAGAAVNVTQFPWHYEDRGYDWGGNFFWNTPQLALSRSGKYVAFIRLHSLSAYDGSLHVKRADGTGKEMDLITPLNVFPTDADRAFANVSFRGDDDLYFFASGSSYTRASLYHYHIPTGRLTNVIGGGTTAAPWTLDGSLSLAGMWWSPNNRSLDLLVTDWGRLPPRARIYVIDAAAGWGVGELSTGSDFFPDPKGYTSCGRGSLLLASAGRRFGGQEVWAIDMDKASPPVQVTNIRATSGYSYPQNFAFTPDCKYVLMRYGPKYGSSRNVYLARLGTAPNAVNLTGFTGAGYVQPYLAISGDGKLAAFIAGPSEAGQSLQVVPTSGGKPVVIYKPAGPSYGSWQLYGIR